MSRKRKEIDLEGIQKIREAANAVHELQREIAAVKEKVEKVQRRRWRADPSLLVNIITIIALFAGAYFQIWLNRPVVGLQLSSPTTYYAAGVRNFEAPPQLFFFQAQNTGQTDITLDVTIGAINSTVSTSDRGPFASNATMQAFIQARTSWANWPFYFQAYANVTSFRIYILRILLVESPDIFTTIIDRQATYNWLNARVLVWAKDPRGFYNSYYLQG